MKNNRRLLTDKDVAYLRAMVATHGKREATARVAARCDRMNTPASDRIEALLFIASL